MPTILRIHGFRIAILTRDEHEPPHVHVEHPSGTVVVLLDERSRQARLREKASGVAARDVRRVVEVVDEHFAELLAAWERIHR